MSKTKYFKTTFTVTVLSEDAPVSSDMEMIDLIREMDSGDLIGQVDLTSADEVPLDKIEDELLAIGNDGTFFNLGDEEDQ